MKFIIFSSKIKMTPKRYFIVTGSASENSISQVLKKVFNFKYDPEINEYHSKDSLYDNIVDCISRSKYIQNCVVYVNCNLNRSSFNLIELKQKYRDYKNKNLCGVICIENLNPRPETLENDIKMLYSVFTGTELENLLNIVCTSSSYDLNVNIIRSEFLKFNVLFSYLGINNEKDAVREYNSLIINKTCSNICCLLRLNDYERAMRFVNNNLFILETESLAQLKHKMLSRFRIFVYILILVFFVIFILFLLLGVFCFDENGCNGEALNPKN